MAIPRLLILAVTMAFASSAARAWAEERAPKSPEANVRITGHGEITSYREGKEISIRFTSGEEKGTDHKCAIPQGQWPHLGSVFFEAIFSPPPGHPNDFPVHSPLKPEMVKAGHEVWFALEGVNRKSLQLYQIAVHIPTKTPAEFNALVRNAVELRKSRNQPEIAYDYQCRLIQSPHGSGEYPDDPSLLERFVQADSIFPNRLEIVGPPPDHDGHGKGLKSKDVYSKGIGSPDRNREKK